MKLRALANLKGPHLIIVAGPNGSGKTTFVNEIKNELPNYGVRLTFINADNIAAAIRAGEIDRDELVTSVELQAAQMADAQLDEYIASGSSVMIETVLSSDKYRSRVESALTNDFKFSLFYVYTQNPEINVERVANRVALGGHDVPKEKIIGRYHRSIAQMLDFFVDHTDFSLFFDNSGDGELAAGFFGSWCFSVEDPNKRYGNDEVLNKIYNAYASRNLREARRSKKS